MNDPVKKVNPDELVEIAKSMNNVCDYLKEDRRVASLDVDKYASAISDQNRQINSFIQIFTELFKEQTSDIRQQSKEVKELALKVEENTRVTLDFEKQRDNLTDCLIGIKKDIKDIDSKIVITEKDVITLKILQEANKELSETEKTSIQSLSDAGMGWIKWAVGGIFAIIIAFLGAAARSLFGGGS